MTGTQVGQRAVHDRQQVGTPGWLRIRRVDKPTNAIGEGVQRIDARNTAYGLAGRGEYGPAVQQGVQNSLPGKYPLSAAQKDVVDHLARFRASDLAPQLAPIPRDAGALTRHVKALATFLKADGVGTCRVPESAYYSHDRQGKPVEVRYENAVVVVMRKDCHTVRASTGSDWMGDPISFQAYGHLALVAETMAGYLRRLGWDSSAQYGPSFVDRYSVLLPPLLLWAGIGEVSRAGIVLNPYLGLGFKAAAVLTDMPLIPDRPIDFGLQRFCQSCRICAQNCPSRAISTGDKVLYNGYETWKLDTRRCASFNFTHKNGTMCNRCVKSCPWTQPPTWTHNLVRGLVTRSAPAKRIAIAASGRLGTGRGHPDSKWWFDLEYVGDTLTPAIEGGKSG
jgi:reductive dehalogenase